jgi:GTP-binding protein HflX
MKTQRAFLIGINISGKELAMDSLEELAFLSKTSGALNAGQILKTVKKIDPAYYISKGMADELKELIQKNNADIVLFDINLSPAQERNLSEFFEVNVIDRTRLILDIFATHAKTAEGKLQVELAMLQYILPRLKGIGTMLSRTGAGIGTRGPGETKLETDRRKIRLRIGHIKNILKLAMKTRSIHRINREKQRLSTVTLVGYTNSGKTTLLHVLTNADTYGEDKLFSTLGTKMKAMYNKNGKNKVIISDTVGFIRNIPLFLVESFKATLEEAVYSKLLIHVIDPIQNEALYKAEEVIKILEKIGAGDKIIITALNKIDLIPEEQVKVLQGKFEQITGGIVVPISAKNLINIEALKDAIFGSLSQMDIKRIKI